MKPSPVTSLKDWLFVLKNRSFRIYASVFILCQVAIDTVMTLAVYFLMVSLQKKELFVPIMGFILITHHRLGHTHSFLRHTDHIPDFRPAFPP